MIERREFVTLLGAFALVEAVGASRAIAAGAGMDAKGWLAEQQAIAADLKAGRIGGAAWQSAVEALGARVDLPDLLAQTDFDRLRASFDFADGMPSKRFVRFADYTPPLSYGIAFFGFRKGQVITPHGHRNMVSAHMVAAGAFRVRNFDRIADEPDALILSPTGDRRIGVRDVSTMSSQRDNIHWFVAEADDSATLDVIIDALDPAQDQYTIDLVDPEGGTPLPDGTIRAPLIDWKESVRRYA